MITLFKIAFRKIAAMPTALRQRARRARYIRKYERILGKEYAAEFYDKCMEFKCNPS